MAETNDYDPGDWAGYDYSSAKSAYDTTAGRGYGSPAARAPPRRRAIARAFAWPTRVLWCPRASAPRVAGP